MGVVETRYVSSLVAVSPAEAVSLEEVRFPPEVEVRFSGFGQMRWFLEATEPSAAYPQAWYGGAEGRLRPVGRARVCHAFDLAQTWGAMRNYLVKALQGGKTIEVHDGLDARGIWPRYARIISDPFDLQLFQLMLEGGLEACLRFPQGREAQRARLHLDRLLEGQTFPASGRAATLW